MTDIPTYPETGARPEPVLRSAAVQSAVTGFTAALIAVAGVFAPGTDLTAVQEATLSASAAVVVLVNVLATVYTAWRARQKVRPIAA